MKKVFGKYDIFLDVEEEKKLEDYYDLLLEWNQKVNLTSIVERQDVIWKHFLDSALIMKSNLWKKDEMQNVLDVGTGAGFPGMVLAILNPEKKFVLLDSLNKRVDFLKLTADQLQLENVTAVHGRAEVYGRNEEFRNQFDFVVSRAVAELPVLMEYCIP
ncbi:MAG: 16S rRNA (guanine(527)-N(7))-methyltransferase RsmG, partial [Eubacterium sp.]|nr:16S rRNA (guanine(527)-N(7))-methyltransferase RsmG [Eubacterium sp.]